MLMWIWIAVVAAALIILGVAGGRLLGRLGPLRRAAVKLQRRQAEAMGLREAAAVLQETVADVQRRAEDVQGRVAGFKGRG